MNKNKYLTYTNVSRQGNNILFLGYDHDGNPVKEKIRFEPSMYLEHPDGDWKTLSGKNVREKKFSTMSDASQYVKDYKDVYKIYGCSDYVRQFVGTSFRGEMFAELDLVQVNFLDIETSVGTGFPEPETALEIITLISLYNRTKKHMVTWGLYEIDDPRFNSKCSKEDIETANRYILEKKIDYRCFHDDEKAMLSDFIKYINSNRIDILSGWNSDFFDIPYLYNRIKNLFGENVASLLSPWKIVEENKRFVMNKERSTFNIEGVSCLDLLDLYKKFNPGSKEEFTLGFICELELGENKIENPGEDFKDFYQNYWATFVLYNIRDVELLVRLDEKKQIINLCMSMAYMAKCGFTDVVSAMRLWESIIYNYFLDEMIAEDWEKRVSRKSDLVGAFVEDPVPGMYKWCASVDGTSKYPSIMMMLNLSPDVKKRKESFHVSVHDKSTFSNKVTFPYFTHDKDTERHLHKFDYSLFNPETELAASNGVITDKTKDGFLRILIKKMFAERKAAKDMMLELKKVKGDPSKIAALNMKQNSLKTCLNSVYGCLSMQYFKYFDNELAEAVTMTGQMIIQNTAMIIDSIMNSVMKTENVRYSVYSDTDSIDENCLIRVDGREIKIKDLYDSVSEFVMQDLETQSFVKPAKDMITPCVNMVTGELDHKPIKHIMKHKVKKMMYKLICGGKEVILTGDHSIIVIRGGKLIECKPSDITKTDKLVRIV